MKNNTEQIGKYLQNEMTAEEKNTFEKQLTADKNLQDELFIQKQLIEATETAGLKNAFGRAIQRRFMIRRFVQIGIGAIIIVAAAFVFYAIRTNMFSGHDNAESLNNNGNYIINNASDTIIETEDGVVFAIPANAFNSKKDKVQVEIKTATNSYDILRQGLSTTSNGELLKTAGMFYINAYEDGKPLSLVKNIDVSVPADKINSKIQLFKGVQDTSGHVNWVNPKPIEKKLRTYEIDKLDFYPPQYISALKALGKDHTNKKYTDSLYYSFSGYQPNYPQMDLDGERIFAAKCGSCHIMGKNFTGPDLQGILNKWPSKQILKEWILNWRNAEIKYPEVGDKDKWGPSNMQIFEGMADAELEAVIKWLDEWRPSQQRRDSTGKLAEIGNDTVSYFHYELDPSRIRAIWNKDFNNTILATKEFEERLKFIHSLCDQKYLQAYIEGIERPMYEIDQAVADNSSGYVKQKFLEFAARRDGGVMLKQGMQEKLSAYFEKKYKAFGEATEKTKTKYETQLDNLNKIADQKEREQKLKNFVREDKNFNEEFCANLTDAYRQIGVRKTCNDTIPEPQIFAPQQYYNVTIDTIGWWNLDAYVFDATSNRESMIYTDPETGKTAKLIYNDVSISITNLAEFDKVLAYLIPDSLSSFQRIDQDKNAFKEKLNTLFKYDLIILGYKGEQVYYYRQGNLQPGQHTVTLTLTTERQLKDILKNYNKQRSNEINEEFAYQLFAQKEVARQINLRKEQDFRSTIATHIFACFPIYDRVDVIKGN